MIRRTFWLGLGIGMGVTGTRRAQRLLPRSVAERSVSTAVGFWGDVRSGMKDREEQLRTELGLKRKEP
jgi:hypothetical protein